MAKLCDTCRNGCKPWSVKLEHDGYTGCTIFLRDHHEVHKISENEIDSNFLFDYINTDTIGFGWIKPRGGMCYNDQPLLKEVRECKFYEGK